MDSTLFQIQNLFYQGAYKGCVDLAVSSTRSPDPSSTLVLLYGARSHLTASPPSPSQALTLLSSLSDEPHVEAVRALARFVQAKSQNSDDGCSKEIVTLTELLDHAVVGEERGQLIRCAAATALYLDGDAEEALETLGIGSASSKEIECVALGVHILLAIHRVDLAEKEYQAARRWADDSLLIQLIEAWIGLAKGGRATQQAFYVYDELAQNPSCAGTINSVAALVGKATALAANGDVEGAKKQLDDAAQLDPENAEVIANRAALASNGVVSPSRPEPAQEHLSALRRANASHPLLAEYESLSSQFDQISARMALEA